MVLLESHANVFPLRMHRGVTVVVHVTGLRGVDGVVSADVAVRTREPVRAALAEDDVAWDDILA